MYQHIMVESGAKVFQKNNRLCIEKDVLQNCRRKTLLR